MLINFQGTKALQQLRIDLQESVGLDFPQACLTELLVLYDVCKYLELNIFQARDILGAQGYAFVTEFFNSRVTVNHSAVAQLLDRRQTS